MFCLEYIVRRRDYTVWYRQLEDQPDSIINPNDLIDLAESKLNFILKQPKPCP